MGRRLPIQHLTGPSAVFKRYARCTVVISNMHKVSHRLFSPAASPASPSPKGTAPWVQPKETISKALAPYVSSSGWGKVAQISSAGLGTPDCFPSLCDEVHLVTSHKPWGGKEPAGVTSRSQAPSRACWEGTSECSGRVCVLAQSRSVGLGGRLLPGLR